MIQRQIVSERGSQDMLERGEVRPERQSNQEKCVTK